MLPTKVTEISVLTNYSGIYGPGRISIQIFHHLREYAEWSESEINPKSHSASRSPGAMARRYQTGIVNIENMEMLKIK